MGKLRLQLIAILLLVALLPAMPAAWTAHELLTRVLNPHLEATVLEGARAGLASTRELLEIETARFAADLRIGAGADSLTAGEAARLTPAQRSRLEALPAGGEEPQRVTLPAGDYLAVHRRRANGRSLWLLRPVSPELVARAGALTGSLRLMETLRRARSEIVSSLWQTFLAVYGAILLVVLALGLLLASRLTRPVADLGRGIDAVARGDWSARVPVRSGGAVGRLLQRFNDMVAHLRRQQAELARLERLAAWRQMARKLAHEIKNPLTPIQLAVQQARDAYPGGDEAYRAQLNEAGQIIEEEVGGLRRLVEEFSRFARLPEPQRTPVDVRDMLAELAGLYGADRLVVRAPEGAHWPAMRCDREQIHRLLINLVKNALEAQEAVGGGPAVELDASMEAGAVVITVADRGPGVPEENREKIFAPDFSTKSGGMGLGLAIAAATAEAHGGRLRLEDRAGGGALFRLELPPGGQDAAPRVEDGSDGGARREAHTGNASRGGDRGIGPRRDGGQGGEA
ncbi:MAG: HAMP domain-containing protein [Candidatus Eisenbacteria bacterium]|nr:HAMP domain-containing protein [Candidatus Eisenbacteria bacterium]